MSVEQIRQVAAVKEKIEALQQEHQQQIAALEQEFARLLGKPIAAAPATEVLAEVALAEVALAEVALAEVALAEVVPAEVVPAEVVPAEVVPAEVVPAEVVPAEVAAKAPAKTPVKVAAPAAKAAPKSGMSAAGRANIIAAQKTRWAKIKATTAAKVANAVKPSQAPKAPKAAKPSGSPKRKISPEGRARIIAGAKARWAKIRAAQAA